MPPGRKKGATKADNLAKFSVGDLVLAKVKGFPAWPAKRFPPRSYRPPPSWTQSNICVQANTENNDEKCGFYSFLDELKMCECGNGYCRNMFEGKVKYWCCPLKVQFYIQAVEGALPRLLSAAAPSGSGARKNHRQCLKVLRLWLERKIFPATVLRRYMDDIWVSNGDASGSTSFKRPS
ncbi:hypothetical protein QQ045_013318 [Rhodiola kirilowii]